LLDYAREPPPRTLSTLQLGMEWFGERAGGLNRVYAHLVNELARGGVNVHGLVAGTAGQGHYGGTRPEVPPPLYRAGRDSSTRFARSE
jgi:hypothetical protein